MPYKISNEAAADIENIWQYTFENWSLEHADRYVNLIIDEIEFLAKEPDSGKDLSHTRKGYRFSRVKSHIIFYRILPPDMTIEIIRVLHQRMDFNNRLSE
jgi:toxin ParE1/3/4